MNDDQIRSALTKGEPPRPDPTFVDRLEGHLVAELAEPGRRGRPRLQTLVAVAAAVVDEPATPSILEPPVVPSSTTPITASSTPTAPVTTVATPSGQISGALPDGTPFLITAADPPLVVEGISAAMKLDRPDGLSQVIGITQFNRIGQAVGASGRSTSNCMTTSGPSWEDRWTTWLRSPTPTGFRCSA